MRSRFVLRGISYPISLSVFERKNELALFDSSTLQISLNKSLIYSIKESVLKDILRHELAHYLVFIEGGSRTPHGDEYKSLCKRYNWPVDVSSSAMNLDVANLSEGEIPTEKILNKIKNLFKLAESSNPHESQLATLKANQLLLKYNLEVLHRDVDDEYFVEVVMEEKRRSSKMVAIYDILKHFMVKPLLFYGKKGVRLEVTGKRANIELACYVSDFLNQELERLWMEIKSTLPSQNQRAKNSFMLGLSRGYDEKMQSLKQEFSTSEQTALVTMNQNLENNFSKIYKHTSSSSSSAGRDLNSFSQGQAAGRNLSINPAVKGSGKQGFLT